MHLLTLLVGFSLVVAVAGAEVSAQAPPASAEHKVLAHDEGTWDAAVKWFMAGPDAEPTVSKGTEVNTLLTGGRWLLSKFEGEYEGAKFEGRGQYGFDANKGKYVGTWIDTISQSLTVLEGTYDSATKTMTYVGDGVGPDGKTKYTQKMVTKTKDDGSRVFTLYGKTDKDEIKFMEITYTKRK
jgi:Protein of unknown function (DUF1579)